MRLALLLLPAAVLGCDDAAPPPAPPPGAHVEAFGFVGVGCDLVRPGAPDGDFLDEVAAFSTTAHLCPRGATFDGAGRDLGERIDRYAARGVRPFVDAGGLLFEPGDAVAPSGGPALRLSPSAAETWDAVAAAADLAGRADALTAIYLADEPVWNGLSAADLARAARIVRATLPDVPLLLVEATPTLDALVVPREVDWIGFDRYGVANPNADAGYLDELARLKARRSRPDQRIVLALDAQWLPLFDEVGLAPGDMASVARSYAALAARDTSVVALIGYLWPGGLDAADQLGARDLPAEVQATYREIGAGIRAHAVDL